VLEADEAGDIAADPDGDDEHRKHKKKKKRKDKK
jgi:hypothetical protein